MNSKTDCKQQLMAVIKQMESELFLLSDFIFQHPEQGFHEVQAVKLLTDFLSKQGFAVEVGYGGLSTAFRAVYQQGSGGPCIGLLCEYDALQGLGHACAHHLQGPSVIGAAVAVKTSIPDAPFRLEVIGTPGEECPNGGKNIMLDNGAFKQLDVALMMHGGDTTTADIKSMASSQFIVTYKGVSAHAAIAPDQGRSPLEALMLVFNGLAYLRGHVTDDVRINGVIIDGGQVSNVIPGTAVANIEVRSYNRPYLDQVVAWVIRVLDGAALMTDTSYEIEKIATFHNKIPVLSLNKLLMDHAAYAQAKMISQPREKTGSTDFASVMYSVPGSCIRVAFIDKGCASHSQAWLNQGLSQAAHDAVATAARILALTAQDLIKNPVALAEVKAEFQREKRGSLQLSSRPKVNL
jgi:aminobenzoyl-glutamate utilization protein B